MGGGPAAAAALDTRTAARMAARSGTAEVAGAMLTGR